ncbi:hypothetical protein NDU88_004702 [Pleurodeles waltl]|uniref:Uncharacterized protein n=1 Tax=Pleurodeles waltl TaxID=8319 RepID=A0AAV7W885_PLEWA|nr:hypothetical protein NDU88_004702 [Pleurodeles waltl]
MTWPARWPIGSTRRVLPDPVYSSCTILLPRDPAGLAEGSWRSLGWRGGHEEQQKTKASTAIAPQGSACGERLTPRWWPQSRVRSDTRLKSAKQGGGAAQPRRVRP